MSASPPYLHISPASSVTSSQVYLESLSHLHPLPSTSHHPPTTGPTSVSTGSSTIYTPSHASAIHNIALNQQLKQAIAEAQMPSPTMQYTRLQQTHSLPFSNQQQQQHQSTPPLQQQQQQQQQHHQHTSNQTLASAASSSSPHSSQSSISVASSSSSNSNSHSNSTATSTALPLSTPLARTQRAPFIPSPAHQTQIQTQTQTRGYAAAAAYQFGHASISSLPASSSSITTTPLAQTPLAPTTRLATAVSASKAHPHASSTNSFYSHTEESKSDASSISPSTDSQDSFLMHGREESENEAALYKNFFPLLPFGFHEDVSVAGWHIHVPVPITPSSNNLGSSIRYVSDSEVGGSLELLHVVSHGLYASGHAAALRHTLWKDQQKQKDEFKYTTTTPLGERKKAKLLHTLAPQAPNNIEQEPLQPTFISFPASKNDRIGAPHPILNIHVKNLESYFGVLVEVETLDGIFLRLNLSTSHPLIRLIDEHNALLPLRLTSGWNKVQMDLKDIVWKAFGKEYKTTERVTILANCRVRRVFFSSDIFADRDLPRCLRVLSETYHSALMEARQKELEKEILKRMQAKKEKHSTIP